MATLNYNIDRAGTLVATSGLVTVTAQAPMFWAIGDSDTAPTIQYKHTLDRAIDKSFNLDTGERLFLFKASVSEEDFAAVTAENPAPGNV